MKRLIYILFTIVIFVLAFTVVALADNPPQIQINGKNVEVPAEVTIKEDQVMIPIRWAAEQMGSSVFWDPATRTIKIKSVQDFYDIEKHNSYERGLESENSQALPLPDRVKDIQLSYQNEDRILTLELNETQKKLQSMIPVKPVTICITNKDGFYNHCSVSYSAENINGHYYVPMDWLAYLFNAKVSYDKGSNTLSIKTPDIENIKSDILRIENILVPQSPDEAIDLWGRGEQLRNGALQYLALSPELRKQADQSNYVKEGYWVTGFSSPWVGSITLVRKTLSDTKVEYTMTYPELTSDKSYTTATEMLEVEKLNQNGQEGWYITNIIQHSNYGII